MNLPTKWAVEITSLQDAERLQKLFPDNRIAYSMYDFLFCYRIKHVPYPKLCLYQKGGKMWNYTNKDSQILVDYTILSITELENLMK